MTIDFKFSEGDFVTLLVAPELGVFEVNGQHCINGAISYTINDGDKDQIKYEYQLELYESKEVVIRKIGFKDRTEPKGRPNITHIGETRAIEVDE